MTKQLIMTADDFGLNESVNSAVEEALQAGRLTSVSLLPNASGSQSAIDIARSRDLSVGMHLNLLHDKPISAPEEVPSLTDDEGFMVQGYEEFLWRYFSGRYSLDEIEREIRVQFRSIREEGLTISHVDSHQHLHLLPGILGRLISVCKEFGISRIRTADELLRTIDHYLSVPLLGLKGLSKFARRTLAQHNFMTNENFLGVTLREALDRETFERMLGAMPPGVTEVGLHLGGEGADESDHIRRDRGWEGTRDFLVSDSFENVLKEQEVSMIPWRSLGDTT